MLARIVDSVKFDPPTTTLPVPFCRPSATFFSLTQVEATSVALLRSTSTEALRVIRSSVVSFFEMASRAGISAGLDVAADALTTGTMLSAFCRCLASLRTTRVEAATGAHADPEAAGPREERRDADEPEEPAEPQPATSAASASGRTI